MSLQCQRPVCTFLLPFQEICSDQQVQLIFDTMTLIADNLQSRRTSRSADNGMITRLKTGMYERENKEIFSIANVLLVLYGETRRRGARYRFLVKQKVKRFMTESRAHSYYG